MKYSTKLSDAAHILAFVALHPEAGLTSEKIAESIHTNPAFVRQMMSALRRGGLLHSTKGHPRPELARAAAEITLLDIYRAVEGDKPLLHQDTHTNPACGVGVSIQLALRDYYDEIQRKAERAMQEVTLQAVLDRYHEKLAAGGASALWCDGLPLRAKEEERI